MKKSLLNFIEILITHFENSNTPLIYTILTFYFVITLRFFAEVFSNDTSLFIASYPQGYLSFISLSLEIIILFYFLTGTSISKLFKLVLPFFIILLVAPLLDFVISLGEGYRMTYFIPDVHENLPLRFFTFFGELANSSNSPLRASVGVTPGIKIEIVFALLMSAIYIYIKSKSLLKSFFGLLILYIILFVGFSLPFVIKIVGKFLGLEYNFSGSTLFNVHLLITFLLGVVIAFLCNKKYFVILLRDIRPFRILHFEFMFVLGIMLGLIQTDFTLTFNNMFSFIFIPISIVFAGLFSLMSDNLEDTEIDEISNKSRPLITGTINLKEYKVLAWSFFVLALFFASAVSLTALFLVFLGIGNYFLYSMPPFRLVRVPIFSKMLIAINSLVAAMLGFFVVTGSATKDFPVIVIALFIFGFGLAINFIDIKDFKGDKKAGIKTLPVIMGLKRSKQLIGVFFINAYLMTFFLVGELIVLVPLLLMGFVQYYLINKKPYSENQVFRVYLFTLVLGLVYLIGVNVGIWHVTF